MGHDDQRKMESLVRRKILQGEINRRKCELVFWCWYPTLQHFLGRQSKTFFCMMVTNLYALACQYQPEMERMIGLWEFISVRPRNRSYYWGYPDQNRIKPVQICWEGWRAVQSVTDSNKQVKETHVSEHHVFLQ